MTARGGVTVILNPGAGRGKALKSRDRLEAALRRHGVSYRLVVTRSEKELRALCRSGADGPGVLVGAGGDSTLNIMVNEIMGAGGKAPVGMIGLGSSNDIPREFGLDALEKAAAALKALRMKKIDLGCVVNKGEVVRFFLGQANIGLGVAVNRYVEERKKSRSRGGRNQLAAGFMGIVKAYRSGAVPLPLTVEFGERTAVSFLVSAVFGNIRYWATGRKVCPQAVPDDGILDACLIGECGIPRLLRIARLARTGRHGDAPEVTLLRSPSFLVCSEWDFGVQVDGEIIGGLERPALFREIEIRVRPRALTIVC